ncbi:MAG: ABC transporter ATP-binding protein [Pseudomonadota bacterium]
MIRLENIQRVFQVGEEPVYALRAVNLAAAKGEYISIMGPSGSGKSTLLNILGLLDRPSEGSYYLDSVEATALSDDRQAAARRHKIGFIFQFFHLIPRLSAADNIVLPLILAGISSSERKIRLEEALDRFGLINRRTHRPDQLSGGQRQRVAIARATIMKPAIILADEPTGNLDRASGKDIINTIEDLNREGLTVIVVTHDPEVGERAARRIKMTDGRVVSDSGDRP